jgi:hypothetical protein
MLKGVFRPIDNTLAKVDVILLEIYSFLEESKKKG